MALQDLRYLAAIVVILVGTFFSLAGVVGYIRLPDVYTRLHAVGKVSVFGVTFLLVSATLITPLGLGKAFILVAFLVFAGPAASHAIASAAYRRGYQPVSRQDNPVLED